MIYQYQTNWTDIQRLKYSIDDYNIQDPITDTEIKIDLRFDLTNRYHLKLEILIRYYDTYQKGLYCAINKIDNKTSCDDDLKEKKYLKSCKSTFKWSFDRA